MEIMLQVILAVIMFLFTFAAITFPLALIKNYERIEDENRKIRYIGILSCLSVFACGTFLGLAMLEMFSRVKEDIALFFPEVREVFPFAEFLVSVGILLMIVIEQLLIIFCNSTHDTVSPVDRLSRTNTESIESESSPENKQKLLHVLVLFISLTFHSVFEGMVVTTHDSENTVIIFLPVLVHKVIEAFGLGLNSLFTGMSKTVFIIMSLIFSFTTPAGMLIGLFLTKSIPGKLHKWHIGIFEGVACGTFLYVVCFQVLPRELKEGMDRISTKWVS
ncbi:zinc transporter ZIP1-like isoform X2 [Lycorma delicatula]|uniref:zinc transporter ZIP1-like isoform X2 n=1 Tax=Lycorma delicatula TaxID=130591 RepID=UPI003F518FF5